MRAFVLMPFDAALQPIYDELIRPALEDAGFEVQRADSDLTQQNIVRDIVAGIASADLVIADLTGLNPNVMYELGAAHGLKTPTVLIAQSIEELPFDLRSYRVVRYSDRFSEAPKLAATLNAIAVRRRDEGTSAFGSPVLDFLGANPAPTTEPPTPGEPTDLTARPLSDFAEEAPKGFLDFVGAAESEAERLTVLLNAVGDETRRLGARIEKRSEELQTAQQLGKGSARFALAVTDQTANQMNEFSDAVDGLTPELNDLVAALEEDLSQYVALLDVTAETEPQAVELRDTYRDQQRVVTETIASVREFRGAVEQTPHVSQKLTSATRRVVGTLDEVIGVLEKHYSLCVRITSLVEGQIARHHASDDDGQHPT